MNTVLQKTITVLDPSQQSPQAREFESRLNALIVGQDRAVRCMTKIYQTYLAGLQAPGQPLGTLLFLGPTGSGKTRVIEATAQVLFGDSNLVTKIDCAEFQHQHEIAKLIGAPPGYLGHRETAPILTQENLDRSFAGEFKLSLVLLDEIEKASDALWQLLLGVLDKATLSLGNGRRTDFSRCVIVMTSNLGAREMNNLLGGGLGFAPKPKVLDAEIDKKIYRAALDAAKRKFSPEFMNRIHQTIVFRSLQNEHLRKILEIELNAVQERIMRGTGTKFVFRCSDSAKQFLLVEGRDFAYGARHLKRAIERFLVYPLSNLIATEQVRFGDLLGVDFVPELNKLGFIKEAGGGVINIGMAHAPKMAVSIPSIASAEPKRTLLGVAGKFIGAGDDMEKRGQNIYPRRRRSKNPSLGRALKNYRRGEEIWVEPK